MVEVFLILSIIGWAITYGVMKLKNMALSVTVKLQMELLKADLELFKTIKNEINANQSENVIPFRKN
jgi:hypothetical protein